MGMPEVEGRTARQSTGRVNATALAEDVVEAQAARILRRAMLHFDGPRREHAQGDDRPGVERNVLWGSDYPHFDCTYPGVVREVTRALGKLSDSARDNILTQNALRFYRLS